MVALEASTVAIQFVPHQLVDLEDRAGSGMEHDSTYRFGCVGCQAVKYRFRRDQFEVLLGFY